MNAEDVLEVHRELISAYQAVYGSSAKPGACCVLDLAAALRAERERVAALETKCDRCGLKLAHEPTPGINYGPVVTTYYPPVVTNAPDQPAQVTFYPQEVIYTPGELSQYPSKTVGEP